MRCRILEHGGIGQILQHSELVVGAPPRGDDLFLLGHVRIVRGRRQRAAFCGIRGAVCGGGFLGGLVRRLAGEPGDSDRADNGKIGAFREALRQRGEQSSTRAKNKERTCSAAARDLKDTKMSPLSVVSTVSTWPVV